jgi:hypothetical protein
MTFSRTILCLSSFLMLSGTSTRPAYAQAAATNQVAPTTAAAPVKNTRIEWQESTLRLIQPGGGYGRIARVDEKQVVVIYERAGGIWVKISNDNGNNWGTEILVARYPQGTPSNPELLILPNGDWLCSFNPRPNNKGVAVPQPFAIAVCRSSDKGVTWSAPETIYRAGTTFGDGCWEPRAILGANNEVQIYFANEAPYKTSGEQEITRMISRDNGRTWGEPHRVSFRAGKRDGMPVPVRLRNGNIVMAIEDDGLNGAFKPVIIDVFDNEEKEFVGGDSPRRWSALTKPLQASTYAGAPYLCQMPDGTTVLSAQVNVADDDRRERMVVWVGDENARNFTQMSWPFGDKQDKSSAAYWNSLWVKDAQTVSVVSGTKIHGLYGLWCIDGTIVH